MTYRIDAIDREQEAEAMVATDSFEPIVERIRRMVTAGRGMILAVREYTYTGRPPVLYGGLHLETSVPGGAFRSDADDKHVSCWIILTNGGGGYHDTIGFGIYVDTYRYSGNESETEAFKRYEEHEAEHPDHFKRRRDMTHIAFTGGLPGWKWQHDDRIVITDWNRDCVATERVLGFEPAEGSW